MSRDLTPHLSILAADPKSKMLSVTVPTWHSPLLKYLDGNHYTWQKGSMDVEGSDRRDLEVRSGQLLTKM